MTSLITDTSLRSLTEKYAYFQKEVEGKMEYLNEKTDNLLDINWISFYDLEKNADNMDWEQQSSIRALMSNKCLYRGDAEGDSSDRKPIPVPTKYIGNTIMAHMAKFEYARVMTHCGTRGNGKVFHTPCSKWKYCERCANAKRQFFFIRYAHIYAVTENPCYFITITMEDKVKFVEGNYTQVIEHWNKMNTYVDSMYDKKVLQGAIIVEEAAFDSYFPHPVINPHLHIMCVGKPGLESHKFEGMKVDVKLINNQDHWVNELNYCHKAINFFTPYAFEWTPENAETINRNFRDMLENHKEVCKNRNQSRAIGIFHAKNKKAIVKTTKETKEDYAKMKKEKANKTTGQKKPKKIKYKGMFEEFSNGVKALVKQKIASNIEAPPIAQKKEEPTPWYKNPLILAGGGLALGAGAYGAGKLYNEGDNILNQTFGKGVDDYLVNPIKGLFGGNEAPKQPTLPVADATTPTTQAPAPVAQPAPKSDNPFMERGNSVLSAPSKPATNLYDMAASLGPKAPVVGGVPSLAGIAPLRPDLHASGLSLAPSADENKLISALSKSYDAKTNMADTLASGRAALTSDRAQQMMPGYANKTPDEISETVGGWENAKTKLDKILSYDSVKQNLNAGGIGHNPADALNYNKNQSPNSLSAPFRDTVNNALLPSAAYELTNAAGKYTHPIASAVSGKMLGKTLTSALGKANPFLAPVVSAIPDVDTGYRLTGDAASDPNSLAYKALEGMGVSEENMKAVGGGLYGAANGGLTAMSNPLSRGAISRLITSALARGAATGTATSSMSPAVSIPAFLTTVAASPAADMYTNANTAGMINQLRGGDRASTIYQQLVDAKTRMDNGEAYAMKGLMNSEAFKGLDTSDPATVTQLYNSLGQRGGNLMMTAKNEGIMGLIGKKLTDIMNNGKYNPANAYKDLYQPNGSGF